MLAGVLLGMSAALGAAGADAPLDAHTLRTIHLDLLGRPPLAAEIERWTGKARAELVDALLPGEEHWRRWYEEQLYYFLLVDNFAPHGERLLALPADLAAGRTDVREALHRIALSPNFEQRNPGADTFVTVVLEQICGLEVEKSRRDLEVGKKIYDGAPGSFLGRDGSNQADLVRIAIESRHAARHLLAREHGRLVHAPPDPKSLGEWTAAHAADPRTFARLAREWLLSPAYDARLGRRVPLPNRAFVRALFVDLLDRLPAQGEAEPLREALDALSDPAPLRGVLARTLIESKKGWAARPEKPAEAEGWVRRRFLQLLGREPRPAELAEFTAVLADPAGGAAVCLTALVTDPEYARY